LQRREVTPPRGDAIPSKLATELKSELTSLASTGLPHVGFLLQHEYTQSGIRAEVSCWWASAYSQPVADGDLRINVIFEVYFVSEEGCSFEKHSTYEEPSLEVGGGALIRSLKDDSP
jgi:hypothetical protein